MKQLAARSSLRCVILVGSLAFAIPSAYADDAITLDPALNSYVKVSGVSGSVSSIGSDTLNNLMTLWAEGFRKQYPSVTLQIEGKGSSTAPPALIEGMALLGPMSRTMKNSEIDAFERKFRYKPTAIPVAIDTLAIYVNKDNPVQGREGVPTTQHAFGISTRSVCRMGSIGSPAATIPAIDLCAVARCCRATSAIPGMRRLPSS